MEEIHWVCGLDYEKCPATKQWLQQMVQHCRAIKALQ